MSTVQSQALLALSFEFPSPQALPRAGGREERKAACKIVLHQDTIVEPGYAHPALFRGNYGAAPPRAIP
jgi:hypothetical protein